MLSFQERIELLEQDLKATPPAFTMSTDLPFAIFRYDPSRADEDEWFVRSQIQLLATRTHNATGKTVHIVSLATLYWKSITESEGINAVIELEVDRGFMKAEEQISIYLSEAEWRPLTDLLMNVAGDLDSAHNILFLTRAGVFAPSSYRLSSLLEQIMGKVQVPTVLFYPGTWRESLNYLGLRGDDEPLGSYRVKIYGRDT